MIQTSIHTKACSAHIAINRGRVKHYGEGVYLKDGQQFEIELFNPHSYKVLAKISINGYLISQAGIVLKPGQRVFLERFIENDKKFLFETYEIENSDEAKEATKENGLVEVFFYPEITTSGYWSSGITYIGSNAPYNNFGNSTFTLGGSTTNTFFSTTSTSIVNCSNVTQDSAPVAGSLETGRVEQGENSSQEFQNSSGSFSIFYNESSKIQILPESSKPLEVSEIRSYCTGCGTRIKKTSWKFCPSCGAKIE
jgi:hypothetical protein